LAGLRRLGELSSLGEPSRSADSARGMSNRVSVDPGPRDSADQGSR
jgi:hypothetical protein